MSNKTPAKIITLADFLTTKEAVLKQLNDLNALEPQIQEQSTKRIIDLLDTLPAQIAAITGKPHSIAEIADMLHQRAKGTFGKVSTPTDRTKRLSVEEQSKITAMLAERVTSKTTIRAIAKAFGTSAQTINAYEKKRLAALKAEAARLAAQTPAETPADPVMQAIKPEVAVSA